MKKTSVIAICALLASGCKVTSDTPADSGVSALGKKLCPDGSQQKANTCPTSASSGSTGSTSTTTTTPSGSYVVSPNGTKGEFDVADNFNIQSTLVADASVVPVEVDPVGAFRFECLAGQLAKDDPMVYPGQPGKSHLHQFFGNTLTNASSTYQSLRTSGGSTCLGAAGNTNPSAQRSAYWMPAMLDGVGNAVKPNRMLTYYKRLPASHPECGAPDATHIGFCVPIPNGLRMINGYNMDTGKGGPADPNSADQYTMNFSCWSSSGQLTPNLPTIAAVVASKACPVGSLLRARVDFPDCWDGKNLDSPDHRSHMSYVATPLANGDMACPLDHPYKIPQMTMQAFYTVDANFLAGKWHLSSDEMMPGLAAGTTLHADYWEAWSPLVKNMWETNCINGHLSCNSGQIAGGQTIAAMAQSVSWPDHVLVSLSSIP